MFKTIPLKIFKKKTRPIKSDMDGVDENHKFIFVHIPKNAGTSIGTMLNIKTRHFPITVYQNELGKVEFEKYFSFCFVRHPYERFISLYNYAKMQESYYHSSVNPEKAIYGKHMDYDLLKDASIHDCAILLKEGKLIHNPPYPIWFPQCTWILDNKQKVLVDYIGKVEDIHLHLRNIKKFIKKEFETIPYLNQSQGIKNRKDLLDEKTKKILAEYYSLDFELFNYMP